MSRLKRTFRPILKMRQAILHPVLNRPNGYVQILGNFHLVRSRSWGNWLMVTFSGALIPLMKKRTDPKIVDEMQTPAQPGLHGASAVELLSSVLVGACASAEGTIANHRAASDLVTAL